MLASTLGILALVATPCPGAGRGPLQEAPVAGAESPGWAADFLDEDRALAERVRAALTRNRIELATLVRELELEPVTERDLGFGAVLHRYRVCRGLGQLGIELVATSQERVDVVVEARLRFSCAGASVGTSAGVVRPTREFRLAVQPAWPGVYHADDDGGAGYYRVEWRSVPALSALERQRRRALGPAPQVEATSLLSRDFELLTSPFGPLTFGDTGGIVGLPLRGRRATDRLVEAGRFDLLRAALRGPNPGGRIFAAEALLAHDEASADDRRAIAHLRTQQILASDGGCTTRRVLAGELLDARIGHRRALHRTSPGWQAR